MKRKIGILLLEFFSIAISCIVAIPIFLILINSFKSKSEAADLSLSFQTTWKIIENFMRVYVDAHIPLALWNSIILSVFSVSATILFSSTSAFIIQRRDDWFCRIIRQIVLVGIILPFSVITTYVLLHELHLTGTYPGIILIYISVLYPFITYLYIGFYNGIPREIDEAAIVDGCEGSRLFFYIIFPLLKPINATAIIIGFMTVWNDFNLAIYFLNSSEKYTLGLTVYFFFGQYSSDWNLVFADLIMISLPVIIVYILLQKHIVSGLTAGAVKS